MVYVAFPRCFLFVLHPRRSSGSVGIPSLAPFWLSDGAPSRRVVSRFAASQQRRTDSSQGFQPPHLHFEYAVHHFLILLDPRHCRYAGNKPVRHSHPSCSARTASESYCPNPEIRPRLRREPISVPVCAAVRHRLESLRFACIEAKRQERPVFAVQLLQPVQPDSIPEACIPEDNMTGNPSSRLRSSYPSVAEDLGISRDPHWALPWEACCTCRPEDTSALSVLAMMEEEAGSVGCWLRMSRRT